MNSGITYLETHPTRSVFRLAAVLLFVLILCLCVSLLTAYGLDIVIPLSFIVGFFLGILVTRHYRRSDLLGGSLGGAVGDYAHHRQRNAADEKGRVTQEKGSPQNVPPPIPFLKAILGRGEFLRHTHDPGIPGQGEGLVQG